MTKAELVEAVAKSASLTKAAAEKAVGAFISTVSGALKYKGAAISHKRVDYVSQIPKA